MSVITDNGHLERNSLTMVMLRPTKRSSVRAEIVVRRVEHHGAVDFEESLAVLVAASPSSQLRFKFACPLLTQSGHTDTSRF